MRSIDEILEELAQKIRRYYGKPEDGGIVLKEIKAKEIWQSDLRKALQSQAQEFLDELEVAEVEDCCHQTCPECKTHGKNELSQALAKKIKEKYGLTN